MKTKLILFLMPILYISPSLSFKGAPSPCTFLLIKSSLLPPNPVNHPQDDSDGEDRQETNDSDTEYSEDKESPSPPQRRRLSGTLIHSLASKFLSPDGVIDCLKSKNIDLTADIETRLKDGFCEPKCYSTDYWGNLLSDPTTRHLIAIVYLNLTEEPSTSTEALEGTFNALGSRFPSISERTCFPAWILNELGELSAS